MILAVAMTFAIAPVVNRLTSDTTTVVRLKQEVGRGTKITEDQVETVKVKTDTMPQGVYVKTADVVGKYASSTLYAGDILTKAKLSGDSSNADDVLATLNGSKVAVRTNSYKSQSDDNISLDTLIANKLPSQMWSTEVKVGPTKYYAEVYNLYSYEYTTCFTADGKPVYQFVRKLNEKQLESATLYKTIQAGSGTSKDWCEMPDGFKKYSADFRNKTLTDANGNEFTIETNDKGDVTSVKDNTGKDVFDDFKWVYDLFEMMS